MTKKEALKQIDELKKFVEEMDKKTNELECFLSHVKNSSNEMLKRNTYNGEDSNSFWDNFSYKISTNGKTIQIPINADSFERMVTYFEKEIENYEE